MERTRKKCCLDPDNAVDDDQRGMTVCRECGQVLSRDNVVSEITYQNNKVIGSNYGAGMFGNSKTSGLVDSSQLRLKKACDEIDKISRYLGLSQNIAESSKNTYKLASELNFIQGRKTRHVCGVVLYIHCRKEKQAYLLIDFSDALQTNLYVLGSIYLKLIQKLNLSQFIDPIDPSLFIHRFCAKLEYKEKVKEVEKTALRIIKSMNRDWMVTGRRPSGLCGAAILIASRIHGFKRTTQQIVDVVNVCDETIKKRIEEFSNTEAAALTKEEFENFDMETEGLDPPSILKKKNQQLQLDEKTVKKIENKAKEIDDIILRKSSLRNHKNDIKLTKDKEIIVYDKVQHKVDNVITILPDIKSGFIAPNKSDAHYNLRPRLSFSVDESLSDIDEKDEQYYLLGNDEYNLKKILWETLNKEWIDDQRNKKSKEAKESKKRKRKAEKQEKVVAKTSLEAVKSSRKFSKRMNPHVLESLLVKAKSF